MTDDLDVVFSYPRFQALVRTFAAEMPPLLRRRAETGALAAEIDNLRLDELLESRFTVAVVGQMRAGKSTLLNALIGRDLAPVGVNETTATINWFRHAEGERCERFRVHWLDNTSEDLPLAQVTEWLGQSAQAARTRALDFFADSEFLRHAHIVDTPGTRSALADHQETIDGFLAEKREADTLKYGGRADAILYVIPPVGKDQDRELLENFGENTRVAGASAYNTIAVVQKWEHYDDPLREVVRKCQRLRDNPELQGLFAEVIPVSGMLARLVQQQPASTWEALSRLATASEPEVLRRLLRDEAYFVRDTEGAVLDSAARTALHASLRPWIALRFALWLAGEEVLDSGPALSRRLWEVSGMDRLQSLLAERFFMLAGLIKSSATLHKAWTPCDRARLQLADLEARRQRSLETSGEVTRLLRQHLTVAPALQPALDFVTDSLEEVRAGFDQIQAIRRDLEAMQERVRTQFEFLDADIDGLYALDRLEEDHQLLNGDDRQMLRRLFGGDGPELHQRLGLAPEDLDDPALVDRLWDQLEAWSDREHRVMGTAARRVCTHARACLERMLGVLEGRGSGG